MKKCICYLLPFFCLLLSRSYGQAPFLTADSVNINNINARVLVHGDMFWNPATGKSACEYPKGTGKQINFASALWMSGYDAGNQLHVAAQTYRVGNDYWPGPLDASTGTIDQPTSQKWAKIWKVDRWDISYFLSLGTHTTGNTPDAILTWPGKGNANAAGNGGVPLAISQDMAPFVDLNGNGIYEPLQGEYPDIRGDQALWWVFNDHGPTHSQSNGQPLGAEIHAMAYGYNRGTLIDNVVYFDYDIFNKTSDAYHDFRMALFDDVELGYYYDNMIGFDSTWRMGIGYKGTNDDGLGAGYPVDSVSRSSLMGMTIVSMPGDTGGYYVPAGSYINYNNDGSLIGNPANADQFNYYIRGMKRDGLSMYNFVDSTHHCHNHDSTRFYFFSGDPQDTAQCSECALLDVPDARHTVLSTNSFTLAAGSHEHVVMALVVTRPDSNYGCPVVSFDSIRVVADTAWGNYYNPPPSLLGAASIQAGSQVRIYPNPAHDKLFIENITGAVAGETITLYNVLGQAVAVPQSRQGRVTEANVGNLPPGLYFVAYKAGNTQATAKFLKE